MLLTLSGAFFWKHNADKYNGLHENFFSPKQVALESPVRG
jgi:hypothetical protein